MINNKKLNLILASNSEGRKKLLTEANIKFLIKPAFINENIIKNKNQNLGISPKQTAQDLADEKALLISIKNKNALVLGSDQICHLEGKILNKPKTKNKLFTHIKKLNNKTHILTSAFSIAKNGKIIYQYSDDAILTVYKMNNEDIKFYISIVSDKVLNSVGGYHLESVGIQLFKKIKGNYFTILGFPLLPFIKFLNNYQLNE